MLEEIRKLMAAQPFVPFVVQLSNGQQAKVPTLDHAAFAPTGQVLIVWDDDGTAFILSSLHIVGLTIQATPASA